MESVASDAGPSTSAPEVNRYGYFRARPWKKVNIEVNPRLATLSDYPIWRPKMSQYIQSLRKSGISEAMCRKRLLHSLPDAEPFTHIKGTEGILYAIETSYKHCFFHYPPFVHPITEHQIPRSWSIDDIYQYSCCENCKTIKDSVNSLAYSKLPNKISIREKADVLKIGRAIYPLLSVSITQLGKDKTTHLRTFDMMPRSDTLWSSSGIFRSTCEERLQLATRWFEQCNSAHNCRPNSTLFSPRRLIQIGDTDQRLHLIETATGSEGIEHRYVALSYCWGSGEGTLTTKWDNIEAHKREIPFDHLPRTIKDAVFICRKLGFCYLWVDALCIVQDPSNTDWLEQSGQMNMVYSNAALTITADESPTCTAGFWHPESTRFQKISDTCWIRETTGCARDVLSTRGWTLQERILSHRILHFSNAGISWECDVCCRFEDGNTKIDFTGLSYRAFRLMNRTTSHEWLGKSAVHDDRDGCYDSVHITDFLTSGSWKSIFYAWTAIMEDYSKRNLTQPSDKLSAVSGLATFVLTQAGLGAESYLAGLWRENLVEGLLWYVSAPRTCRSSSLYIAPTWSWASITGSIQYFRDRYQFHFTPHVSISQAYCATSAADPTGRVTEGVILLSGLMVEVDLAVIPHCHSFTSSYQYDRVLGQQVVFIRLHKAGNGKKCWYEIMYDEETELTGTDLHHLSVHKSQIGAGRLLNDTSDDRAYFCLSIGDLTDTTTGGKRDWFLILQKTGGNDVYKRVGIGYYQYSKRKVFSLFDYADIHQISLI